jgi:hypothetical protein
MIGKWMALDMLLIIVTSLTCAMSDCHNMGQVEEHIERVFSHLVDDALSIFRYADDTIVIMEYDVEKVRNFKLILSAF